MIDSADRDRIDEARLELERILADREMRDCLLMVFANKQDIAGGESGFTSRMVVESRQLAADDKPCHLRK